MCGSEREWGPDTAAAVEDAAGVPCDQAVGDEALPAPAPVTGVAVFGQWAKVTMAADGGTAFLAMFHGGWRVVAAGCHGRGDRPYDCELCEG
ncbi:hypothetical protein KZZ52_24430 [Dactylosporangium sp. AC04546]|uniref:hypothetical protein n=1 Tax=Dactylosporangium sp. AC04546 TaxID=2862460 RepID=UPI001EDD7EFC|nr:hypothetical protein [Dactylosporangium sp. AC04546]WVK88422.1 hypothetical protein KZZ52_24430 [Dactylosporangium sp. AC04546]